MNRLKGRVRKFGDNVDTDNITPAAVLHLSPEELKKHAFEPIFAAFHETVRQGDVIVAGHNFGCGSSREQATEVLKELGIRYIVCESMARIYFRNCIALGLYPIIAKGVSAIFSEAQEIEIDFFKNRVISPQTGETIDFKPLTGIIEQIFQSGGILPLLKQVLAK